MRRPTDIASTYDWWRFWVYGGEKPEGHLVDNEPKAGFYRVRPRRGAPFEPAAIWLEQVICPETGELMSDEQYVGRIGLNRPFSASKLIDHWLFWIQRCITEEEYWRQIRQLEHERDNPPEPEEPAYEPEHIRDMPPSF